MSLRTIKNIFGAIEQSEGAGARVRRSIGNMNMHKFNPFLLFDHFSSTGTNGFPEHPHLGQETITLMLKGAFAHEDFTGSKGVLHEGDLQFMTAGRGIVHSEMPIPNKDGSPVAGLQLWVDLPESLKEVPPRYRDLKGYEIPEAVEQDGKLTVRVISGRAYGIDSVKDLAYTPVHFYHYILKPGAKFEQELPPDYNFFLYALEGNGLVLDNKTVVNKYDNVFFNRDGTRVAGENSASNKDTIEFVLIGGEVLDQKTVHHGPFVAANHDRIRQGFRDYQYAQNSFANLRTWKTLISQGVTQAMIDGELCGSLDQREKDKKAYLESQKPVAAHDEL